MLESLLESGFDMEEGPDLREALNGVRLWLIFALLSDELGRKLLGSELDGIELLIDLSYS